MARTGTLARWQPFAELDGLRGMTTIPLTAEPKHETRTIAPKAA